MRAAIRKREKNEREGTAGPADGIVAWAILAGAALGLLFAPSPLASSSIDSVDAVGLTVDDGSAVSYSRCGQNLSASGKELPDGGVVTQGWSNQTLDQNGNCSGAPRTCDPQNV